MTTWFSFPRWERFTTGTAPCWNRPASWREKTAWWWPAFSSIPSSSTIPPTSRPIPAPLKRIWRCARERAWITCFPPPRRRCIPGSAALPWRRAFYPLRCAGRPAPDIFPASARCLPSCSTWCSPRTPFSARRITSSWRLSAAWCVTWISRCTSTGRRL